jgi:histidyl-tRNA synthetase
LETKDLPAAFDVIDKVEREDPSKSLARLAEECGLSGPTALELLRLVEEGGIEEVSAAHGHEAQVAEALSELREFLEILGRLGLADFISIDLRIVRGLAYYTGIVFEIFDRKREFRAICGGGRYDRLLELVGGEPLPAAGFGMGDVVLTELLADRGLLPSVKREADLFLVAVTPQLRPLAQELARAHRDRGRRVLYPLKDQSVKKQFSAASTEGARWVVVLGPDEVEQGAAVVRDMDTGNEERISLETLRRGDGLGSDGV